MNKDSTTLNMREVFNEILIKLNELELEFQENKGIILTEYDLQCLLFRKLYDLFSHNEATFNPQIKGSPLHTEITFFDENGKLNYKPDITIIRTENYSIVHSITEKIPFKNNGTDQYENTPSKGFAFCGDAIIIELKFCHAKNGIIKIDSFKYDWKKIKKIKELVERGNNRIYGIVAIFNRTNKISENCRELLDELDNLNTDIRVKYYTGNYESVNNNL